VEQLGSGSIDVRLGGIFSLERLARDSVKVQPTIIEILSAFVRTQAPANGPQCVMPELVRSQSNAYLDWEFSGQLPTVQVDVLAAVTVIGRRDPHHDAGTFPELSNSCLVGVGLRGSFAGANFESSKLALALFHGADLRCAVFASADLSIANFDDGHLNRANFFEAKAKNAQFAGADMRGTELSYAELDSTNLGGANLSGADLDFTTLTDARLRGGKTLGGDVLTDANLTGIQYDERTKFPADYHPPPSTEIDISELNKTFETAECLRGTGP
jgi:uncharacterized protein YjbI with pentapeptide repeats